MQKSRMVVWRKLKSIAAINVLQSIWILPQTKAAEFNLKALEKQINEEGAKSICCVIMIEDEKQNQKLIDCFNSERKQDYGKFLDLCDDFAYALKCEMEKGNFSYAQIRQKEREVRTLQKHLNKIIKKDYFNCPLQSEAIGKLKQSEDLFSQFSNELFNRSLRTV